MTAHTGSLLPHDLRKTLLIALITMSLAACTWVKVDDYGLRVQAISPDQPAPSHCNVVGEVGVSVPHEISFYKRDEEKIAQELEKLARNEAGRLAANVIQAISPPQDGRQRFQAYQCE